MGKTIARISGIIVDSFYDDDYFADYIDKGILTPASRFVFQVASAREDLEIHVNSFGGDVFSANSMIIAVTSWAASHPDAKLDIIVESIALSAAANFVAMAPKSARIHAFENSLVMFHSCSTFTFGGPGAHKDAADLMDKINGSVKAALARKTTLDGKTVDTWFQDDRQGWLTGPEAVDCKLIDDILDGAPVAAPEKPSDDLKDAQIAAFYSGQHRMLAAYSTHSTGAINMPTAEDENKNKGQNPAPPDQNAGTMPNQEGDGEDEDKDKKPDQEGDGEDEDKDKKPDQEGDGENDDQDDDDDDDDDDQDDETPEQKSDDKIAMLEQRVSQLEQENADLKQKLDKSDRLTQKLTKGLNMKGDGKQPATSPQSFDDLVKLIPKDLPAQEWRKRYLQLKKENKQLFVDTYGSDFAPKQK